MNAKQVWQAALGELQVKVPGPSFQTWLKNTSIASFEEDTGRANERQVIFLCVVACNNTDDFCIERDAKL